MFSLVLVRGVIVFLLSASLSVLYYFEVCLFYHIFMLAFFSSCLVIASPPSHLDFVL